MMSKKWTFSLTSLITIIALAFVVPAAVAGEFGVSLDETGDVSHADGFQIQRGSTIAVPVKFDQAVVLDPATKLEVASYKADGTFIAPSATDPTVSPTTASKELTITITLPAPDTDVAKVTVKVIKGIPSADPNNGDTSKEGKWDIGLLAANENGTPDVYEMAFVGQAPSPVTTETFDITVLLSEMPKGGLTADHFDVANADVKSVIKLVSPSSSQLTNIAAIDRNGDNDQDDPGEGAVSAADQDSWRDGAVHLYLVTIGTQTGEKTATIRMKSFAGMENPASGVAQEMFNAYNPGVKGRDYITIKTNRTETAEDKLAGVAKTHLPHGDAPEIPANGFYLLVRDAGDSGIIISGAGDENDSTKQTPAQLKYNARAGGTVNLEQFLANGGTIDLTTTETGIAMGDVVISEIMWGSNLAVADSANSQWIEIHNTTASPIVVAEEEWTLNFYGANEDLPTTGYIDRVGTRDEVSGTFWSLAGKGQSGRTDLDATGVAAASSFPIISMQRARAADGTYADGTMESNWSQSVGPAVNFLVGIEGARIGTPGATPVVLEQPTPPEDPPPVVVIPPATASDIKITEIMVDTGNGRLPQWIELTSSATGEVSLEGWQMVIDNAIDDAVHGKGNAITVSLAGPTLDVSAHTGNTGKGQSVLVVAWTGGSVRASDNIRADRVINLAKQLGITRRYQLLSYNGFKITLVPPDQMPVAAWGDVAGNLDEDWELPMDGRSSLIRREMDADGMATLGTDANGWVLASSTALITGQQSYYGDDEDAGTPGQDSGGPLPVELSHFRPARDKATGAVVITWATQSELNNAGFFIKRSQQRNGEFKVINATMIAGAGTTSEKQFYTYTDTTAQPNVVYYYQIEDVSLDGNRQTLTRGIRLKGHIGAAGKLTSTWGELKSSNE